MKRLIFAAVIIVFAATLAIAGNVHRDGAGVVVSSIVFLGASSATVTIPIQEQ